MLISNKHFYWIRKIENIADPAIKVVQSDPLARQDLVNKLRREEKKKNLFLLLCYHVFAQFGNPVIRSTEQ